VNKTVFRKFSASLELLLAASLWGFGFIAAIWALPSWIAVPMMFWRFVIGAAAGLLVTFIFVPITKKDIIWQLKVTLAPALFLALLCVLQTWGLQYTTATKSSFITILYIVLVPLLESVVARKKIAPHLWLCILISLIGVYLIVDLSFDTTFNVGDLLTFLCAIAAALQIIAVDRVSQQVKHPFFFNSVQTFWAALLLVPVIPFQPGHLIPATPPSPLAWAGLLALALGSTLIAFYLQVRAQRVLSSTVSSIFFLIESPFALLFAYILLGERLKFEQGLGAILILTSAMLAVN
jgi:drug/metabolite transporter (DMT)-like permease